MRPVKRVDLVFHVPWRCAFYSIIGFSSLGKHESPQNLVIRSIPCCGRGLYPKCHFRQIGRRISQYAILSQGGDWLAWRKVAGHLQGEFADN